MKRIWMNRLSLNNLRRLSLGRSLLTWIAILILGVGINLSGAIAPAFAANPDHVAQLLETNACVGCDLEKADLRGMNLRGSNLEGANLEGAYLMATNLRHANLKRTNLKSARLYAAVLTDADLTDSTADAAFVESATLCHTRIPSGKLSNRDCDRYSN